MFKSLLLLSALLGINSMPVAQNSDDQYYGIQERQYQHTEDVGNTAVTYKYESNEVNSVDDLVVGNIYRFVFNSTAQDYIAFCNISFISGIHYKNSYSVSVDNISTTSITLYYNPSSDTLFARVFSDASYYSDYQFEKDVVIQFVNILNNDYYVYFSYTDYNDILSIDYTPPTTIFGHLAEVLGDNLYGGIPNVDNVIFNIGGQDVTLKSWLVTSTCIVLAVVLITILCLFIRWLFKLFSNTILLR